MGVALGWLIRFGLGWGVPPVIGAGFAGPPPSEPEPAAALEVVWLLAPDAGRDRAAYEAGRAHLGLDATVVTASAPAQPTVEAYAAEARDVARGLEVTAVLFVARGSTGPDHLYLFDPSTSSLWQRELSSATATDVLWAESAGLIAASAVRALVSGRSLGMTPVELPAPRAPAPREGPPSPPPASPAPRAGRFEVKASYRGTSLGSSHPWQSGADVAVELVFPRGATLGLGYGLLWPVEAAWESNRVVVQRRPARLIAGYRATLGRRFDLRPALAVEVDVLRRTSSTDDPDLRALPPLALVDVGLAPALEGGVRIAPFLRLFAEVRLELWVRRPVFAVATPVQRVLLEPSWVRPTAQLGLAGTISIPWRK